MTSGSKVCRTASYRKESLICILRRNLETPLRTCACITLKELILVNRRTYGYNSTGISPPSEVLSGARCKKVSGCSFDLRCHNLFTPLHKNRTVGLRSVKRADGRTRCNKPPVLQDLDMSALDSDLFGRKMFTRIVQTYCVHVDWHFLTDILISPEL